MQQHRDMDRFGSENLRPPHLVPAQRGVERDSHGSWQFWCPPKAWQLLRSIEPQFPRGAWGGMDANPENDEVGIGIPRGTFLDLMTGDVRFFSVTRKAEMHVKFQLF